MEFRYNPYDEGNDFYRDEFLTPEISCPECGRTLSPGHYDPDNAFYCEVRRKMDLAKERGSFAFWSIAIFIFFLAIASIVLANQ